MADSVNVSKKQQRTIMDFYLVLAELTTKNGYSQLSVSEIVGYSGYNRATFYKYFKNKEELAQSFVEYICHDFTEACRYPFKEKKQLNFKRMHPREMIVFSHILKNAQFYQLLIVDDTIPKLQSSLIDTLITILDNELIFTNFQVGSAAFNSNTFYKAYGFYGLIHEWIKSDFSISAAQITQDIITILATDNSKANIQ
jgi:AcrR family transcriptional regulator